MPAATDKENLEGRKFRFVVRNTQEAVATIREHLGENAHVISVNKLEGKGLNRFLSAPKLEIIATVRAAAEQAALPEQPEAKQATAQPKAEEPANKHDRVENSDEETLNTSTYTPRKPQAPEPKPSNKVGNEGTLERLLRKADFDAGLLSMLRCSAQWDELSRLPLGNALAGAAQWLAGQFHALPQVPFGERIAFIGTPGAGKTTLLCKRLAWEVIQQDNETLDVVKLEDDAPNADDKLRVFCDVLGLQLWRDTGGIEAGRRLYLDIAGVPALDREGWARLGKVLDREQVETRALVLNAAYSRDMLRSAIARAQGVGVTHIVLTHLDEAGQPSHLWPLLLRAGLPVAFYGAGQDLNGEIFNDVCGCLMERTFDGLQA